MKYREFVMEMWKLGFVKRKALVQGTEKKVVIFYVPGSRTKFFEYQDVKKLGYEKTLEKARELALADEPADDEVIKK